MKTSNEEGFGSEDGSVIDGEEGGGEDEEEDQGGDEEEDQDKDEDEDQGDDADEAGDKDEGGDKWIYAVINSAKVGKPDAFGTVHYETMGKTEIVDLNTVQCVVGRIRDRKGWAIVDRSGGLARLDIN